MKVLPRDLAVFLLVGIVGLGEVRCGRILVLTAISMVSHKNVYTPLMEELAKRGHEITMVSPVKSMKNVTNIREVVPFDFEEVGKKEGMPNMFEVKKSWMFLLTSNPFLMGSLMDKGCRLTFDDPEVQEILREKWDMVFLSSFLNDCTYGMAYHLNTTTVLYSTIAAFPWTVGSFGGPNLPSFVPLPFLNFHQKMSYGERLINFVAGLALKLTKSLLFEPIFEKTYREKLGEDIPSVGEIERNASLILSNSHFSINHPRPLMPDVIDVGGMHCRPAERLPKDIEAFLNGAGEDGFVYFSMGSGLKAHTMPEESRRIFRNVFAKLPQRVLWKWETGEMEDLPLNVGLCKWCPQQDILGHKNIKVFLTHGGLLSTQEAVYHGVPIVGIPMFGDQMWNMHQSESRGIGIGLDYNTLNEEDLLEALQRVIHEARFREKVGQLSIIFRDQPETPLERAVYWMEYVLRHKGATHMRSAGRYLNSFQYYSGDVILTLVGLALILCYINYRMACCVFLRLCRRKGRIAMVEDRKKEN